MRNVNSVDGETAQQGKGVLLDRGAPLPSMFIAAPLRAAGRKATLECLPEGYALGCICADLVDFGSPDGDRVIAA